MAVRCAQCGEELLGAVNRCWRCGANVLSRAGDANLPPVRRPPLAMPPESSAIADESEVVTAAFADPVSEGEGPSTSRTGEGIDAGGSGAGAASHEGRTARRVGSPFAGQTHGGRTDRWRRLYRSRASAGVIAGFVLSLFAIVAGFFTVWAVLAAIIGLGLGLWGLTSAHRGTAVATILLCCLTLLIGSFVGLADWYESHYGYKPWDAPEGMRM